MRARESGSRQVWLTAWSLLAACTAACTADDEPDRDAGSDAAVSLKADGSVECCPPDDRPNCCMVYGGAKAIGSPCELRVCDGMPVPSDPAWKLVNDPHGCPRWSSKGATLGCCGGEAPVDGGPRSTCFGDYGEPPQTINP